MSDYISREAVLARLKRIIEVNRLRTDMAWFTPDGVEYLINEPPAADVRPRWIPVTERLPEVRTWVLCYCRANSFDVFRMTDEGHWQYGNRSIYMKGYVTHWMPLPELPKEDEN